MVLPEESEFMDTILWGCIADDFMNAVDAASFFEMGGLKTVLYDGIPKAETVPDSDIQAVVIALDLETAGKDKAVEEAISAFDFLSRINVKQYYYKFSLTFGSVFNVNVGPVSDALMNAVGETKTIICPANPLEDSAVERGKLYLDGVLSGINQPYSSLRNGEIAEIINLQSNLPCINVDLEEMLEDDDEVWNRLNAFEQQEGRYYIIPDCVDENDADRIVELFGSLRFLAGSSSIIKALVKKSPKKKIRIKNYSTSNGKAVIISGSCSDKTVAQCEKYISDGGKAFKIDAIRLLYEKVTIGDLWNFVSGNEDDTVLIYSSESADNVKYNQRHGAEEISRSLESSMSELVDILINNGYTRIIITGSKTVQSIIKEKLGYHSFFIGKSVSPGVPVITPVEKQDIRFVLKSSDYGDYDFFSKAIKVTEKKQ